MAFSSTTFFNTLKRVSPISAANLPAGYLSTFAQSISANAGTGALAMDATVSATTLAGQSSLQNTFSSITTGTNQDLGLAQFISSPLTAQTVATAGTTTWTVRAAALMSNAAANFTWTFRAALYLVNGSGGSVGTIKTTIFALTNIGAAKTTTAELTAQQSAIATANTATAVIGDYLVLEWGINANNTSGGSLSPNITFYADGITAIGSDGASTSNASSQLVCSTAISTTPIITRAQIANPFVLQYRSPGWSRAQVSNAPVLQQKGPGWSRKQIANPAPLIPRAGDVDVILMRGFDSSLGRVVYWYAGAADPTGAQYQGNQSTLSDIVAIALTNTTGG